MKPNRLIVPAALVLLASAVAQDSSKTATGSHDLSIYHPDKLQWVDGPPSLPPGAKMVVLEGDPAKEGLFTMRVRLPDGYAIAPHTHPAVEHVTVISGTMNIGMGEKFDQSSTQPMVAGTFGWWHAGMKHFAWFKGETVIQVHGIGPWKIEYLNPADDPRKQKAAK